MLAACRSFPPSFSTFSARDLIGYLFFQITLSFVLVLEPSKQLLPPFFLSLSSAPCFNTTRGRRKPIPPETSPLFNLSIPKFCQGEPPPKKFCLPPPLFGSPQLFPSDASSTPDLKHIDPQYFGFQPPKVSRPLPPVESFLLVQRLTQHPLRFACSTLSFFPHPPPPRPGRLQFLFVRLSECSPPCSRSYDQRFFPLSPLHIAFSSPPTGRFPWLSFDLLSYKTNSLGCWSPICPDPHIHQEELVSPPAFFCEKEPPPPFFLPFYSSTVKESVGIFPFGFLFLKE